MVPHFFDFFFRMLINLIMKGPFRCCSAASARRVFHSQMLFSVSIKQAISYCRSVRQFDRKQGASALLLRISDLSDHLGRATKVFTHVRSGMRFSSAFSCFFCFLINWCRLWETSNTDIVIIPTTQYLRRLVAGLGSAVVLI